MGKDSPEVLARVTEGLDLVEEAARNMHRHCGTFANLDDLRSHGREVLLAAARTYDPDHGVPFRKWASLRVRGGMIDAVRKQTILPKRIYRKLRALEASDLVNAVTLEEALAAPVRTPEAADAKLDDHLASAAMAIALGLLTIRPAEALEAAHDPDPSPESSVGQAQLLARIREAIEARPEPERTLLTKYYYEDIPFDETAKALGLSKSWASRLHTRGLEAVAKQLRRAGIGP